MKKSADKTHSRNQDPQALFGSTKLFNMKVRDMQSKSIQNPVANEVYDDLINNGNWVPVWPSTIRAKVGSVLASLVIEAARIPVPSRDPETNQKM
jgi:DNA-directed RNA polymerase